MVVLAPMPISLTTATAPMDTVGVRAIFMLQLQYYRVQQNSCPHHRLRLAILTYTHVQPAVNATMSGVSVSKMVPTRITGFVPVCALVVDVF